ncbi:MAG: hypothetical protein QXK76_01910 [Candidatus Woesearchaeota archaeon]
MNKYLEEHNNTLYANIELLSILFDNLTKVLNEKLIKEKNNFKSLKYIDDIDAQNGTFNIYLSAPEKKEIASKIFITFHVKKNFFGREKYILTINLSSNNECYPKGINKKLPKIIKKEVKKIKKIPEFKGRIKSIKI